MIKKVTLFLAIVLSSWATSSQAALIQEIWQTGPGGIQLGRIEFNSIDGDCTANAQCNDLGRAAGHIVDFEFDDPVTGTVFDEDSVIPGLINWLINDTTWELTVQNTWQFQDLNPGGEIITLSMGQSVYSVLPGQENLGLEFRPVEDPTNGTPEPGSLALLGLGLLGLGLSRRRKA